MEDFFVIDSDNMNTVRNVLYGFIVTDIGIFDESNMSDLRSDFSIAGGAYVLISVSDETITLKQDFNGSWGLYLYRDDDYFAISNSVTKLL